ncbi:unnamed protein product, partial [Symbiodinium sp. CCMP2456]
MARHLQMNTWQNSAFNLENIRNGRWLVGSCGRGVSPYWQAVETVTPAKQLLFMERVLFAFNVRKKQVRQLSTARATSEQWELMLESSCLLHQLLEDMKAAKDAAGAALFADADVAKARQRDHLKKEAAGSAFGGGTCAVHGPNEAIKALDMQSVQKAYEADLLKLAEDCSRFSEYLAKITTSKRQLAIARVLKLKSENRRGATLVVDWMQRNAKFAANDYVEEHMNIIEAWLGGVSPTAILVWADLTKSGTLQADFLDDITEAAGFIIAPTMVSSKVVAGKRGELRRVEDKLDNRSLTSVRVNIRMEPGHGNRRLPLIFPAYVAVNDASTSNIFGSSK